MIHVRQVTGRTVQDDRTVETPDGLAERDYLALKAASAEAHGWTVKWLNPDSFEARKVRWGGKGCKRTFTVV